MAGFGLPHPLTDHDYKPRGQTKHHMAIILCHNSKLTGGMSLLYFQQVCTLCAFYLPLSSSSSYRNYIEVLSFHQNFPIFRHQSIILGAYATNSAATC